MLELKLNIGGIVISLISDDCSWEFESDNILEHFITDSKPDLILRVHYSNALINHSFEEKIFDSGNLILFKSKEKYILCLHTPVAGSFLYGMAIIESNFRTGNIYIDYREYGLYPVLIKSPLFRIIKFILINLLPFNHGVLLHGCGVSDSGIGVLFTGTSGAGKSTLANLWKNQDNVIVLSDEHCIIRKVDDRFWIYGTPWHSNVTIGSPEGVPLEHIFFISHTQENIIVFKGGIQATTALLTQSFSTFWDQKGMQFTLQLLDELCQTVPCYGLGFVPNESVIDFVRSMC